jgi:hypothetical protein
MFTSSVGPRGAGHEEAGGVGLGERALVIEVAGEAVPVLEADLEDFDLESISFNQFRP